MKGTKLPRHNNNKRKRPSRNDTDSSCSRIFLCPLFVFFNLLLLSGFTFSTFHLLFGETFRSGLLLRWLTLRKSVVTVESPVRIAVREVVTLPDQLLVFLNYPRTDHLFTKEEIDCVYFPAKDNLSSAKPLFRQPPLEIDGEDRYNRIVRCSKYGNDDFRVSVGLRQNGKVMTVPTYSWDSLAYDAVIDHDNTTVVFVKGLNLRPDRVQDASRFECLYGWDFRSSRHLLRSDVVSLAQEIVRCKTPLSVLMRSKRGENDAVKVSVRMKGRRMVDTIARPGLRPELVELPRKKKHVMCICSMVRNQGRFLKEWVMYHTEIGVQRWFIYDNNSDDDTDVVIEVLQRGNYNITRHVWPWIKTQEAGFSHCALRAREMCQWVGFIDVDEFFHMPSTLSLHDVLRNQSMYGYVGEVRISCLSFGPSGLRNVPVQGVTVEYICRLATPERHKSTMKPEALDSTLMNVVHHFHLRSGYEPVNADRGVLVINHYKYQVWEVFKEKFYRRVATYVADWQEEQNVGSRDRTPGLGTKAVEPPDWAERFCEVNDSGLRNRVFKDLADPDTGLLPWQEGYQKHGRQERHEKHEKRKRKRKTRRRKHISDL